MAVKTLREEHSTQEKRTGFVREVKMMLGLVHPCIVKLVGVCLGPPLMMVYSEFQCFLSPSSYYLVFPVNEGESLKVHDCYYH